MKRALPVLLPALLLWAAAAQAQDRADIDRTQIIGNSELPKVLYIVPWKKPLPSPLSGRPVKSVLDDALSPLERDVFRREIDYGRQLQGRAEAPPTASADAAVSPSRQPAPNGANR